MRCAMNFGMDYYLFGKDAERQELMARRLIDFFEKDGYKHARFNWDGSNPKENYTIGEAGCNAVACYCLLNNPDYKESVKKNLKMAWDAAPMKGQYRYYDGLVHYLSMLHLCGSFKIWKPAQKTTAVNLVSLEVESEAWYTLDGKRLSAEPTQRGIYIRNGKKIYVK